MCSTPLPVWLSRRKNKRLAIARAPVDLWLLASLSSLMDCEAHGWARQPHVNFGLHSRPSPSTQARRGAQRHARGPTPRFYWRTLRVKYHDSPIWISLLVSGAGVTLVTPLLATWPCGQPSRGMRPYSQLLYTIIWSMCDVILLKLIENNTYKVRTLKLQQLLVPKETKQTSSATPTGALKHRLSHGACDAK